MSWEGAKIKTLAKERGITLLNLSGMLKVSRQTINDWIKDQIPRGYHLIQLSTFFGVNPEYFFSGEKLSNISVPLHRIRGVAKVTDSMMDEAINLAKQYEKLFLKANDPGLVPVLRLKNTNKENALALAKKLRKISGIESDKPMDYSHLFALMSSLNIITIFRYFPPAVKGYAFYCRILNHRIIFVNNQTNVLDLIFPLLHETVHAIRDEEGKNAIDTPEEEVFCDMVAGATQFPEKYVKLVFNTIKDRKKSVQINLLKKFARNNSHSIFGIVEEIRKIKPSFSLNVGGANTNVRKEFFSIGDILFDSKDARDYVQLLRTLSPHLIDIITKQIDGTSNRRIAELLGVDTSLDGRQLAYELKRK